MNLTAKVAGPIIKRFICDDEDDAPNGLAIFCKDVAAFLSGSDSPLAGTESSCIVSFSRARCPLTSKVLVDGEMRKVERPGTMFRAQVWLHKEAQAVE